MVSGKKKCFQRLAHFLKTPVEDIANNVRSAIRQSRGHIRSYFGNEWDTRSKRLVEWAALHSDRTLKDFEFWGYKPNEYDTSIDCESLPWLNLTRAKKGPLPGDDDPFLQNSS